MDLKAVFKVVGLIRYFLDSSSIVIRCSICRVSWSWISSSCSWTPFLESWCGAAFKSIYGTSIAAHIKEHRMEQAAKTLKETDKSIAEIARAVGYDSQSRFTAAFKTYFKVLPKEYRKK